MPPSAMWSDRRGKERTELEIKSLEDAHRFVEIVKKRDAANNSRVKAWRFAKQAAWLLFLVVAFLVYYLIDAVYFAVTLP